MSEKGRLVTVVLIKRVYETWILQTGVVVLNEYRLRNIPGLAREHLAKHIYTAYFEASVSFSLCFSIWKSSFGMESWAISLSKLWNKCVLYRDMDAVDSSLVPRWLFFLWVEYFVFLNVILWFNYFLLLHNSNHPILFSSHMYPSVLNHTSSMSLPSQFSDLPFPPFLSLTHSLSHLSTIHLSTYLYLAQSFNHSLTNPISKPLTHSLTYSISQSFTHAISWIFPDVDSCRL